MKFIKTQEGQYINVEKIWSLEVKNCFLIAYFLLENPETPAIYKHTFYVLGELESNEKAKEVLEKLIKELCKLQSGFVTVN